MKHDKKEMVYFSRINHGPWSFYIAANRNGLCFVSPNHDEMQTWFEKKKPKAVLTEDAQAVAAYGEQLKAYLNGERKNFDLAVELNGTAFQESVWKTLQKISFGETKTYADIARNIGKPGAVRAVGTAIGSNPILIIVPCHRVINKNGKLGGFRGGIAMKKRLLELEGKKVWNG